MARHPHLCSIDSLQQRDIEERGVGGIERFVSASKMMCELEVVGGNPEHFSRHPNGLFEAA